LVEVVDGEMGGAWVDSEDGRKKKIFSRILCVILSI
jgi:hypothetical protein